MRAVRKPLIALAAGGTGGHVFPALAVAESLRSAGVDTILLTDQRGAKLVPEAGHVILPSASPFQIGLTRKARALALLAAGSAMTLMLIMRRRPAAMIGFGGYPAFAPLLATRLRGVPSLLHEQNAFLGRANRMLANWTGHLALSWDDTRNLPDGVTHFTAGMPVRSAFFDIKDASAKAPRKIGLTIIGGSLGAGVFADLVPAAIDLLPASLQRRLVITQQCRAEQIDALTRRYAALQIDAAIKPFFNDMPAVMAGSHLVISRAGASSVAELAAAGRAAVLMPFAAAMDDHQSANALQFEKAGGGMSVKETGLTPSTLAKHLEALLSDPAKLAEMGRNARRIAAPHAADCIAKYALDLAGLKFDSQEIRASAGDAPTFTPKGQVL
jgi:UDP-N-acetylglucosamine--N-acetylmuramyl-(pentapeptide) pyrophosphoryl-undecaprenol N-acetylglucosamine transferase